MLFDANSAGMEDATNDETIMVMACDVLLACFIANDEFASKYIGKLLTLGNTVLSAEAYREYEANYINEYGEFLIDNHKRFYGNNLDEDVIYQLFNNLRTFYDSRLDEMIRSTKDLYSLNEATEAVLNIEYEADFGTVDIDRCPIKLVENRWRGRYLTGVCLTVNAIPAEGHKVAGIKVDGVLIEADSYEFYVNDTNMDIEIIFE